MDENLFWLRLWQTIILSVIGIFAWLIWVNHLNEKQFIQAGYSRESLPGITMTQWVKK